MKKSEEFRESLRSMVRGPRKIAKKEESTAAVLEAEKKRQEELIDIQAELQKKFDELFGSISDEDDDDFDSWFEDDDDLVDWDDLDDAPF